MKRLITTAALLLMLCVPVYAQCPGGSCPMPRQDWGWRPSPRQQTRPQQPAQQARPYVCRIQHRSGIGSGTLVCIGRDYGAVLTCAHLFSDGASQLSVTFSGGKRYSGTLSARDRSGDLAIVRITPRPNIPIVSVAKDFPKAGDRLSFAGYGARGQYREIAGTLNGYRQAGHSTRRDSLEMTGGARGGDSGGPILNARGELVGVLWGTDGRTTLGTYNGRICQFTLADRYVFPWNADLANKKDARRNTPTQPPIVPLYPPTVDNSGRLGVIESNIARLRGDVNSLQKVADAAKVAAASAKTEAGKAFAKAVGVGSEVEGAKAAAKAAGDAVGKLDGGLLSRMKGVARTAIFGILGQYWWVLVIAGGLVWLIRKDILDKAETGDKLLIEKIAARTKNPVDDRIADFIASRVTTHADPEHGLREELRDLKGMVSGLRDGLRPKGQTNEPSA